MVKSLRTAISNNNNPMHVLLFFLMALTAVKTGNKGKIRFVKSFVPNIQFSKSGFSEDLFYREYIFGEINKLNFSVMSEELMIVHREAASFNKYCRQTNLAHGEVCWGDTACANRGNLY